MLSEIKTTSTRACLNLFFYFSTTTAGLLGCNIKIFVFSPPSRILMKTFTQFSIPLRLHLQTRRSSGIPLPSLHIPNTHMFSVSPVIVYANFTNDGLSGSLYTRRVIDKCVWHVLFDSIIRTQSCVENYAVIIPIEFLTFLMKF